MNRSRCVIRQIDKTDRAIISALFENGRMTLRELAEVIELSSPSVTDRIEKLKDAGAIQGYAAIIDPKAFELNTVAYVRMRALPGQIKRLEQLLIETPEVVEADHVTGEDCFVVRVVVRDVQELEAVVGRFVLLASTDTAIIQSTPVVRRLPRL
ncbi:MAG: winged helix-turn-helix transcriptional regulator [Pseudomonadota bacterium]|jgi:Lrp/AsnC family leucine-responsive transcriptional regulator|nr:winged helix-turn-helix transcriptional regulator [Pseudomonadota bacterium]